MRLKYKNMKFSPLNSSTYDKFYLLYVIVFWIILSTSIILSYVVFGFESRKKKETSAKVIGYSPTSN
jgi:heme/copper-type cytochrome/quinol oxidase subunit 2